MTAARDELRMALAAWRELWGDEETGSRGAPTPMRVRRAIDAVLAEEPAGVVVPAGVRGWAEEEAAEYRGEDKVEHVLTDADIAHWILSLPTAPQPDPRTAPEYATRWAQWWKAHGPPPLTTPENTDARETADWILSLPTAPPAPEGTDLRYWQDLANDRKAKLEEARETIDRLIAALRGGS